jgi:hypothetical protein
MKSFTTVGDAQVVQALQKLMTQEMRPLLDYLAGMAKETDVALRKRDGIEMYRLQGRAMMIQEIMDAAENAATVLEKLRK